MKQMAFGILALTFFGNMLISAAWAKPCMLDTASLMVVQIDAASDQTMPCHQANDTSTAHCEGLCLCDHVMMQQVPTLPDTSDVANHFVPLVVSSNQLMAAISQITFPQLRPPKHA